MLAARAVSRHLVSRCRMNKRLAAHFSSSGGSEQTTARPDSSHPAEQQPSEKPIWEDPWRHLYGYHELEKEQKTLTEFETSAEEFKFVEDLLPIETIPEPPKHDTYPTPSGWYPPDPDPCLPYHVSRTRLHVFPTTLERRRDRINPETYEIDYREVVALRNVEGDVFACESDLREFLESRLQRKVATHVNELQGIIRVSGADRVDVEAFLVHQRL